jgi:crotonobetainyl-CoA:carnitine CoA-transferase CaiB-like acyl-CoA transferase
MVSEKGPMLAPYRVLDLTTEFGFLCGRLLADLGADVIKVERPGGDPSRNIGPFYHDIAHPEKSLHWFFYNANKRGVTLDIESTDGKSIFEKMVKKADFVIESFATGYIDRLGLGYESLSGFNPRIILTSISPFGQTGPYRGYKSTNLVSLAISGWMNKCGDPDKAPLQMGVPFQDSYHASAQGAVGALMAHYSREITGEGQHVDASSLPPLTNSAQAAIRWYTTKINETRHGQLWEWATRPLVRYVWDCKDGAVCFSIMGGARFGLAQKALIQWMDSEGQAPEYLKTIDWENLDYGAVGQDFRDRFEEPVIKFFKQKSKAEIFDASAKRGIVLFPANTAREIVEHPQLAARGYWVDVEHPEIEATITCPGPFFLSSETAWKMTRRAPLIGEHNEEIYINELGFTRQDLIVLKQNNII